MDKIKSSELLPDAYLPRYLTYIIKNRFKQTIDDYRFFYLKKADPSDVPFTFGRNPCESNFQHVAYHDVNEVRRAEFGKFMEESKTTAFIVIKGDAILLEKYFNGYDKDTVSRFFSVSKSFASTLFGIAMDEGLLRDVGEPVADYIPELASRGFNRITFKNLLNMDSGIHNDESTAPWSRMMHQYLTSDMRRELLNLKIVDEVGSFFHYNDFHTGLLGLVLERVTGKPVIQYFEEKIWKPIGSESPAYYTTDSKKNCFEKLESGLTGKAIDLAKFGRLFLNNGNWDGKQIVSEKWVKESTSSEGVRTSLDFFRYYDRHGWGNWFRTGNAYYKHMWWGYKVDGRTNDFFALGALGQILYISPRHNTIVVRLGKEWGIKGWWPTIIKNMIDSAGL